MVFYFTGTGNSLYIAKELDENAVSIPQIVNSDNLIFTDNEIGIVCPIYGHEMPALVKDFLKRATFNTEYLFLVLTYGARHGNAVELAQNTLSSSGKKADYLTTILMVDNFLPAFDMNEEMALDKKIDKQLALIKDDIRLHKAYHQKVSLQDRVIHKMYVTSVKNKSEAIWADFSVTDDCIGCGICTKVCPVGDILLKNQKAIHTNNTCQACYACIHACPKAAICLNIREKNKNARYRNPNVSLYDIVAANNQTDN